MCNLVPEERHEREAGKRRERVDVPGWGPKPKHTDAADEVSDQEEGPSCEIEGAEPLILGFDCGPEGARQGRFEIDGN